jgi:Mg2+-importing ATPase
MASALDEAIIASAKAHGVSLEGLEKVAETPYDFVRRRYGVSARQPDGALVAVTKGAVNEVLGDCIAIRDGGEARPLDSAARDGLQALVRDKGRDGFRPGAVDRRSRRGLPRRAAAVL